MMLDISPHPSTQTIESAAIPRIPYAQLMLAWFAPVAVALLTIIYTGNVWEDYLITFRHSRNLVVGNGLVFQPGERVHGFTSPINTLLPALFDWVCGAPSIWPALRLYQAASLTALGGAGVFAWLLMRKAYPDVAWAPWLGVAATALEPKSVLYSANGQEAGFLLLYAYLGLWATLTSPARSWLWIAASFAGLQYTRPDGFVYCGLLSIASIGFMPARRALATDLVKGTIAAILAYLPWIAWASWYYGSPIPHTIIAKAGYSGAQTIFTNFWGWLYIRLPQSISLSEDLVYAQVFAWSRFVSISSMTLGCLAALYCLAPWTRPTSRVLSVLFLGSCIYLANTPFLFPWYLVLTGSVGLCTVGCGIADFSAIRATGRFRPAITIVLLASLAARQAYATNLTLVCLRSQQQIIEDGQRTQIGLWLRSHVKPNDRVFLECLGYIGYFSQARMLDYPGLVSPAVVSARRGKANPTMAATAWELQPEWMVLRPFELEGLYTEFPACSERYKIVKVFDARDKLGSLAKMAGVGYLAYDSVFVILRRSDLEDL